MSQSPSFSFCFMPSPKKIPLRFLCYGSTKRKREKEINNKKKEKKGAVKKGKGKTQKSKKKL